MVSEYHLALWADKSHCIHKFVICDELVVINITIIQLQLHYKILVIKNKYMLLKIIHYHRIHTEVYVSQLGFNYYSFCIEFMV